MKNKSFHLKVVFLLIFGIMTNSFMQANALVIRNENCANFKDVPASNKFCEAITFVRDKGNFQGNVDGYFNPGNNINRAEVLKVVLLNFMNPDKFDLGNIPDGSVLGFNDTPSGTKQWWYVYLKQAKTLGIIQGYNDGNFKGENNVTRAEFLKIMLASSPYMKYVNNVVIDPNSQEKSYLWADTPTNAWYAKYMAFANVAGLFTNLNSCGIGKVCPETPITRGEVAQMFLNLNKYEQQLSKSSAKTRDLTRLADLNNIMAAIETYNADHGHFPSDVNNVCIDKLKDGGTKEGILNSYFQSANIPKDPEGKKYDGTVSANCSSGYSYSAGDSKPYNYMVASYIETSQYANISLADFALTMKGLFTKTVGDNVSNVLQIGTGNIRVILE